MKIDEERRKRGQEVLKKYRSTSGTDKYSAAADAIVDILLCTAEDEDEGAQILRAAEADYREVCECENFAAEG